MIYYIAFAQIMKKITEMCTLYMYIISENTKQGKAFIDRQISEQ